MRVTTKGILKSRLLRTVAVVVAAASASAVGAQAQTANTTPANVNLLNLLSPFLSLNSTSVGQTTLKNSLSTALSINNNATPALEALAISDKNILNAASNTATNFPAGTVFGAAANLAGGLPAQPVEPGTTITPTQLVGGYGPQLGAIYDAGVNAYAAGTSTALANTVKLLSSAYNFTSTDLGVAKYYFANGTTNGTSAAEAPGGYVLPTFNGLPNMTNSVYDLAYGVTNTQANQDTFGDSRPVQVAPNSVNGFDPSALTGLATNPSFPSGHTTYAYTDSLLLAMLTPQEYQSMLTRASQYANSRIVLGVHYPLDIIGSRALASYDLSQALSNPLYINNAATTGTAINLPALFTSANTELNGYLSAQCGASVASCAAGAANTTNNPYSPSAANLATYTANLTYGLPTLTFAQAPREAAPAGGPDASILLATVYGGSASAALAIAPGGGLYGNLQTSTIDQIVVNTETNALAAFYGTSLSYWTRINLEAADAYFQNVAGVLTMATTDQVNVPVTVGATGVLVDNGSITGQTIVNQGGTLGGVGKIVGATTINSGGVFAPGVFSAAGVSTAPGTLTVNGSFAFNSGSTYLVQVGSTASLAKVSGAATLGGATVSANFAQGSSLAKKYTILSAGSVGGTFGALTNVSLPASVTDTLSYDATHAYLNVGLNFSQSGGLNANQQNVGGALGGYFNSTGGIPTTYATLAPGGLSQASGEVGTGSHYATFNAMNGFVGAFFNGGGVGDDGLIGGRASANGVLSYADPTLPTHKSPALAAITPQSAFTPSWSVWAESYGGSATIGGSAATGSNTISDQAYGVMVGADYRATPDTVLGFGFGGGGTNFGLANAMGSGSSDLVQVGVYGVHNFGSAYVAAAAAYGYQDITTNRTVTAGTGNNLQAKFNANALEGRVEAGDRIVTPYGAISPYAALQVTGLFLPSYGETSSTGSSAFALNYAGQTVTDTRTEIGARVDKSFALSDSVLTLSGRLAWAHDFNTSAIATATFQSLPGASFVVNGAAPDPDSALVSAGAEVKWANGFSVQASFEGEFSGNVHSYGGRGTLRYTW